MCYIRAILFNLLLLLSAFILSIIAISCFWLPYSKRYGLLTAWQRFIVWLAEKICGIRYIVTGRENLPKVPFIIASNHQSTWETLAFFILFPNVCYVLKKELIHIPFFGWALRLLEPIAIDRSRKSSAMEQVIKQGCERLQVGRTVIIFPQGKRMPVNEPGLFRSGAAKLAKAAKVPLVPVTHDAGKCWPRQGMLKYPGTIHIEIKKPIYSEELTVSEIQERLVKSLKD